MCMHTQCMYTQRAGGRRGSTSATDYRLPTPHSYSYYSLLLLLTTTTHYYYCSLLADYSSPTRHRSPRLYEYSTMAAPEGFEGTFVAVTSVPGQGQGQG